LIEAIERQAAILGNEGESPARRREALKYVLHLVGDLHQPFHVVSNNTPGYDFRVRYLNRPTDLHTVWDTDLIKTMLAETKMTESRYAQTLASKFRSEGGNWSRGTIAYWAIETHTLAREVYPARTNNPGQQSQGALSQAYYNQHKPTIERQLARAGFRLAQVLNSLFAPQRKR
jgi:hypothetical protein